MALSAGYIAEKFQRQFRSRYDVISPNFYSENWFEADLFCVSRAGHFHEFEIKISRSDYLADFKKARRFQFQGPMKKKHVVLAEMQKQKTPLYYGPRCFSFVCPEGLISVDELPAYAGLRYVSPDKRRRIITVVKAPTLKAAPVTRHGVQSVMTSFYHRYWRLREKLRKELARGARKKK